MHLAKNSLLQGGKYKIVGTLGHGGFGITYLGLHVALNRKVAIKEFFMKEYCERDKETSQVSLGTSGSRELVERFRYKFIKEAQTIATLDHPHIIRIYDVFEENGTAYYVMEYHGNGSLADYVNKCKKMDEAEALQYIQQIADALDYIHERKMNHLDVKPGNVLLNDKGKAVLIDFGMSKRYDEEGKETSTTPVGISHGYAPLEQYNRGGIGTFSPATDIYSLGATLFKLLTGQTPPDANVVMDEGLPSLSSCISERTMKAIKQAMHPIRRKRPQNINDFLALIVGQDNASYQDVETTAIDNTLAETYISNHIISKQEEGENNTITAQKTEGVMNFRIWLILSVVFSGIFFSCYFFRCSEYDDSIIVASEKDSLKVEFSKDIDTGQFCPVDSTNVIFNNAEPILTIRTSPSKAAVYADGEYLGTTPIVNKKIKGDIQTIKITREGYETITRKIESPDKPIVLDVKLNIIEDHFTKKKIIVATSNTSGIHKGHEWVDLGLSVMWATCNIGASKPEDYGDYFAWGEIHPKQNYRYDNSATYNQKIDDISGDSNYDVARVNWGGHWRMPTREELYELVEKCTWGWSVDYKLNTSCEITGPNGNSISIPIAGYRNLSNLENTGTKGFYWSSSPAEQSNMQAYCLYLNFDKRINIVNCYMRDEGRSIRPVFNSQLAKNTNKYQDLITDESYKSPPTFGLR